MYLAVSVPEDLLARLRAGALKAVLAPILEPGDDWDSERNSRVDRIARLLCQIGWNAGEAGEEVAIDILEHARALHEALGYALPDALRDLRAVEGERRFACAGPCGQAASTSPACPTSLFYRGRWPVGAARRVSVAPGRCASQDARLRDRLTDIKTR